MNWLEKESRALWGLATRQMRLDRRTAREALACPLSCHTRGMTGRSATKLGSKSLRNPPQGLKYMPSFRFWFLFSDKKALEMFLEVSNGMQ